MRNLNDADLKGKRVLLRVDINSPLENGKIADNPRLHAHAGTITGLTNTGAKLILLAHQGRKGERDFTSLESHSKLLESMVKRKITFVNDIVGVKAKKAIADLQNGDILLLDNVRMLEDEETHTREATLVKELSPLADAFVLDAFSIAHRGHASVTGFAHAVPCYPGPVIVRELEALRKVNQDGKVTFIIGGSKVHDAYLILKRWLHLGRVDRVLLSGIPGILALHVQGHAVGKSHGFLTHAHLLQEKDEMKELFATFGDRIRVPDDVGIENDGRRIDVPIAEIGDHEIKDIGSKTAARYADEIGKAHTVIMNGSPGVYEQNGFGEGTKALLQAMADSPAFTLIGGGHTIAAVEKFGIPKEKFGYISLAGKAFLQYLEGKELPGLKALEENELHRFG